MNPPDDPLIRITREDATSEHVTDLLKRQASLRGEGGVTRDRTRRWYYQNWFIFAIVGALGAFAGWAVMKPYFDDHLYFQGKIQEHVSTSGGPEKTSDGVELSTPAFSRLIVNKQTIWLAPGALEILPDGKTQRLDVSKLEAGMEAGFYVEHGDANHLDNKGGLAFFVKLSPPPQSVDRAKLTLSDLQRRTTAAAFVLFPVIAAFIGLFIGAVDGLVCRLPRRALLAGGIGMVVGFLGTFVSHIGAEIIYMPLTELAQKQMGDHTGHINTYGFGIQILGRALAWGMAGMCMGLGPGIALRSWRLFVYGLIGGIIGGLFGGLFFDPIDTFLVSATRNSAWLSRLVGFTVIGLCVGLTIGLVELLARDAWLGMVEGPLRGKEFLIFKDVMKVGSSPRSDLYLFNDPLVAENHALIRAVGEDCEIEALQTTHPLVVNSSAVKRARLRHGDRVTIGRTVFVFQKRRS